MRDDCERTVDAAAYVLGALEAGEVQVYAEHLQACAVCGEEVAQLQSVADALAIGVPRAPAPTGLGARVMAVVYEEAELAQTTERAAGAASARAARRGGVWGSGRGWLRPALLATGALVAGLLIGAFAINTPTSQRTEVIRAEVIAPGYRASADLRKVGNRLQLILNGFPAPPRGRIYEVWLERGAQAPAPTDVLFSVTKTGTGTVAVPSDVQGVSDVLVTDEPLGGSPKPTRKPIIVAKL
jgi:anti-sigma-K factor RskA